jgi:arylsulfatase A-like enzyme
VRRKIHKTVLIFYPLMASRPNVLFLVVDSLRYDAVCDDGAVATPNFDRLFRDGVSFDRCFTQGVGTSPSMTATLTGRLPLDYGGHRFVHERQPTVAEEFRRSGYSTGAIHSNPNVSRMQNYDRGFQTYDEHIVPIEADSITERLPERSLRVLNKLARVLSKAPYLPAEEVNERLVDWISDASEPWFLWTQYMDVHGPYLPGGEFTYRNKLRAERLWQKAVVNSPEQVTESEHEELRRNYRLEVEYLDRQLGALLDALSESGSLEDTIVVLMADHGDEFYEHGQYGHGNYPYDELVHVPLSIRFPERFGVAGTTVPEMVRCMDVLPTVADLAGVDFSDRMRERMTAESLREVIVDGESPSYDVVVIEKKIWGEDRYVRGFRTEEWKYIHDSAEDSSLLFDLTTDPGDRRDVSETEPEALSRFDSLRADRVRSSRRTSADVSAPELEVGSGVSERLEALGYR